MSLKGSAYVEHETSEVQNLRKEDRADDRGQPGAFVGRHEEHAVRVQEGQRPVGIWQR